LAVNPPEFSQVDCSQAESLTYFRLGFQPDGDAGSNVATEKCRMDDVRPLEFRLKPGQFDLRGDR